MNAAQRTLRAQLGAQTMWARTPNRTARTAAAREGAEARYERLAREMHPGAPEAQIIKVAAALRTAHYKRMALKSAQARAAKNGTKTPNK